MAFFIGRRHIGAAWLLWATCGGCSSEPDTSTIDDGSQENRRSASGSGGESSEVNFEAGGTNGIDFTEGNTADCVQDVTNADTVPVDLYVMFDQSKSMEAASGFSTRLDAVRAAVADFLREQGSDGLGVGIGYFGTMPIGETSCDPADYATPAVTIAPLPGNASALIASLNGIEPVGETPTGPAIVGACQYARSHQEENPEHRVAILLVTDGVPEADVTFADGGDCNPTLAEAVAAAGDCASGAIPIPVYVLGVGSALTNMNQIAEAGNTGSAHLVEGGDVTTEVLRALSAIRGDVIPCEFTIPPPPEGEDLDYSTVNVQFTSGGGEPEALYNVRSAAECGAEGGWYYDDAAMPQHILLCDSTCDRVSTAATGNLDFALGCEETLTLR